jgi:hypothetical protein
MPWRWRSGLLFVDVGGTCCWKISGDSASNSTSTLQDISGQTSADVTPTHTRQTDVVSSAPAFLLLRRAYQRQKLCTESSVSYIQTLEPSARNVPGEKVKDEFRSPLHTACTRWIQSVQVVSHLHIRACSS